MPVPFWSRSPHREYVFGSGCRSIRFTCIASDRQESQTARTDIVPPLGVQLLQFVSYVIHAPLRLAQAERPLRG